MLAIHVQHSRFGHSVHKNMNNSLRETNRKKGDECVCVIFWEKHKQTPTSSFQFNLKELLRLSGAAVISASDRTIGRNCGYCSICVVLQKLFHRTNASVTAIEAQGVLGECG